MASGITYWLPYLYRYEQAEFIDLFFNEGKLRLSAFAVYQQYTDNQLGDPDEGKSMIYEGNIDNEMIKGNFKGRIEMGLNDYCFCTSTLLNEKLMTTFNRNSVFRIKNPQEFFYEVHLKIPELVSVLCGNCVYLTERNLGDNLGQFQLVFGPDDSQNLKIPMFGMNVPSDQMKFVKLVKYQIQSEFRFLFSTANAVTTYLDIECPEAVKFCERVNYSELEEISKY